MLANRPISSPTAKRFGVVTIKLADSQFVNNQLIDEPTCAHANQCSTARLRRWCYKHFLLLMNSAVDLPLFAWLCQSWVFYRNSCLTTVNSLLETLFLRVSSARNTNFPFTSATLKLSVCFLFFIYGKKREVTGQK